jgi:hypothetical protein
MPNQSALAMTPRRVFQFRLATLLWLTAYAALICFGLRSPQQSWLLALITVITLAEILTALLIAIYRTDTLRAAAIGFVSFCSGYLLFLLLFKGTLGTGLSDGSTPFGELFDAACHTIHAERDPKSPVFGRVTVYVLRPFISICNYALATLLGLLGSLLAQYLYATQPREKPTSATQ